VEAVRDLARRSGRTESDLVGEALRRLLARQAFDEIAARNAASTLSEDEAMALAVAETKAHRAERRGQAPRR
jgi:hypothetical protein